MRVIVAEDNYMRDFLVEGLPRPGIEVIGGAGNTQQLLKLVDEDPPDIVILDLEMPREPGNLPEINAGIEAARKILQGYPSVGLLVLSQYAEIPLVQEIISLGSPVGYLLKDRVQEMNCLLAAMQAVAAGGIRIDKSLIDALFARKRDKDPIDRLTSREYEVLWLIAQGLANAAIAEELSIEEKTVEGHETLIYRKLELSTPPTGRDGKPKVNVRVMAVLTFLKSGRAS